MKEHLWYYVFFFNVSIVSFNIIQEKGVPKVQFLITKGFPKKDARFLNFPIILHYYHWVAMIFNYEEIGDISWETLVDIGDRHLFCFKSMINCDIVGLLFSWFCVQLLYSLCTACIKPVNSLCTVCALFRGCESVGRWAGHSSSS